MGSLHLQSLSVYRAPNGARGGTHAGIARTVDGGLFEHLHDALNTARELGLDAWDFALDVVALRAVGVTDSELRRAIVMGFVDHRMEVTASVAQHRSFLSVANLQLTERSCFVLTEIGEDHLVQRQPAAPTCPTTPDVPTMDDRPSSTGIDSSPEWDSSRRQLRVGRAIVKEYKVPAANQEIILATFHELGWPPAVDDPLPPRLGIDRKRRLHDAINSLNRNQRCPLLKFRGKGDGQGVRWQFRQSFTRLPPDSV